MTMGNDLSIVYRLVSLGCYIEMELKTKQRFKISVKYLKERFNISFNKYDILFETAVCFYSKI